MSSELLKRELALFHDGAEARKGDHRNVMECYSIEETVVKGIFVFDLITRFDDAVRSKVRRGEVEFRDEFNRDMLEQYRNWLATSEEVLLRIESVQTQGYAVARADELRSRVVEARGLLTPDRDFFTSDKLVDLRDQALDEHAAGQTHEHRPG